MTAARKPRRAASGARLTRATERVRRLRRERFAQLIALAKGKRRALILTHDNPDPDSIAGGVALAWLLKRVARVEPTVAYGGIIGRAENRALVKVLHLPLVPVSRVDFEDYDLVCMVDTQPDQGNHSLPPGVLPDVIIDHHPRRPETARAPFADVSGPIGASSTVVAEYARASGLRLPPRIATALFYGIKADTRDLGRMTTQQDVDAYLWLFPMADKDALRAIEYPRLPASYFRLQHTALERLELWGDVVILDVGDLYAPDMVAELAERFHLLEESRWALAFGRYGGSLWFSLRTSDLRANAGRIIRRVIEERGGSAGGHGSMAGARLPVEGLSKAAVERLKSGIVRAFLRAFRVRVRKPKKLV
ncbi:MAG: DHH family phosphoesterase [Anaeromyxobacteraceae bacterium]